MELLKPLIDVSEFKTDRLRDHLKSKTARASFEYDDVLDTAYLYFVEPQESTAVHYLDDHVGLLFEVVSLEIVGLQVDDFEHSFIPKHANVERVWELSETDTKLENIGDLMLTVEKAQPVVIKEIVTATESLPTQIPDWPQREIGRAMALA